MTTLIWTATRDQTWFNGCVQIADMEDQEVGIFKEKHPSVEGGPWTVRYRLPGGHWGLGMPHTSKRAAIAHATGTETPVRG